MTIAKQCTGGTKSPVSVSDEKVLLYVVIWLRDMASHSCISKKGTNFQKQLFDTHPKNLLAKSHQ